MLKVLGNVEKLIHPFKMAPLLIIHRTLRAARPYTYWIPV